MSRPFEGQSALICGGAGRLGGATAKRLAVWTIAAKCLGFGLDAVFDVT